MKQITILCAVFLIFYSCSISETVHTTQKTQTERENLLKSYGEIRQQQDKRTHEFAVQDQLIGKWKLVSLTYEEGDDIESKLAIQVSLAASTRQHLTLEFFREYARYGYKGKNGTLAVEGDYKIDSLLYGEKLYPVLKFTRREGETMERFLWGEASKPEKSDVPFSRALIPGVSVTFSQDETGMKDILQLTRYGRMELRPEGWVRTGHIHCTLEKIK